MQLRNSETRFGLVAVALHWLVALLFLFMLGLGVTMTRLSLTDPWTFPLYQLHKSIGVTIFLLVVARVAWRAGNSPPPLPAALKPDERVLAQATHWGLYAALVLMPLTGWVIVSASTFGIPTVLYGAGPHSLLEANGHRADENLNLEDLRKATKVVALTLFDLLGG